MDTVHSPHILNFSNIQRNNQRLTSAFEFCQVEIAFLERTLRDYQASRQAVPPKVCDYIQKQSPVISEKLLQLEKSRQLEKSVLSGLVSRHEAFKRDYKAAIDASSPAEPKLVS